MKNTPIIFKITIVVLIPLLLMVFLSGMKVLEAKSTVATSKVFQKLSNVAIAISDLVHECQKERGATAIFNSSKGNSYRSELNQQRDLTDIKFDALLEVVETLNKKSIPPEIISELDLTLEKTKGIKQIREKVNNQSISGKESIAYYTDHNATALNVIQKIAGATNSSELSKRLSAYVYFQQGKERAGINYKPVPLSPIGYCSICGNERQ